MTAAIDAPARSGLASPRRFATRLKALLPRGLFGRSVLLLAAPLILSQIVGTWVFYDRFWITVMRRLAAAAASDIVVIIEGRHYFTAADEPHFFALVDSATGFTTRLLPPGTKPPTGGVDPGDRVARFLAAALTNRNLGTFSIDDHEWPRHFIVRVADGSDVLQIAVPRDRLYTSLVFVVLSWMVGTALVTLAIAMLFLRNQVRSLRRLAITAEAFGRGLDVPSFRPQGATEVRQAAAAFLSMRQRIQRQIAQRTEMLAGISHDLRTPLTRMRLELELMGNSEDVRGLKADVAEMLKMVEAYLSFARGEGDEPAQITDLMKLLGDAVASARRAGIEIALAGPDTLEIAVRPDALRRCVTNLITNAARHGSHVWVTVLAGRTIDIMVDDDGPGIPEAMREAVFQPFFRLDNSRNVSTGGSGLGLTIARDIMLSQGGSLTLDTSPQGGLRARCALPATDVAALFDSARPGG
ncbi:MAG TPA: ATP-binding protein [Stellaceae bacterium]|nr:ATP-binding protein [Stellaceae bacterium]